ncbi:unnamed protein product [Clonostachys chloroleuca]|uniref:Uncharacterized protein n=1 Tax=Clonostachys chloroleuca TaxID=1926264 RepID=A0AA35MDP3_9HYPO|nr:unnamed protein product [Clonostachys chloroleuca]
MTFSNNELFQKGLPDCRQMVSNLNVDRSLENGSSEFGFPNQQLEIREAIRQASIYCGVPAGMEATKVAEATLNDMEQRGEYVRQLAVKAHDA